MNHYMSESHSRLQDEIFFTEISFSSGGETKIKGYHVRTKKNIFLCVHVKLVLLGLPGGGGVLSVRGLLDSG